MPYINSPDRLRFQGLKEALKHSKISTGGELNHLLTLLVHRFLECGDKVNYQAYSDALAALEGAKMELYRQFVAPYEDQKIQENGNVPEVKNPDPNKGTVWDPKSQSEYYALCGKGFVHECNAKLHEESCGGSCK